MSEYVGRSRGLGREDGEINNGSEKGEGEGGAGVPRWKGGRLDEGRKGRSEATEHLEVYINGFMVIC